MPRAYDKAIGYLRETVARVGQRGDHRLPTIDRLATECGVARITMSKAVRTLVEEGVLSSAPRRGIWIDTSPAGGTRRSSIARLEAALPKPVAAWERIRCRLADCILRGHFPPGSMLPSAKELCARYGVSHATLRKALLALAAENRLIPHKRGYRVYTPERRAAKATIVFIGLVGEPAKLSTYTNRAPEFWRTLEQECRRYNVELALTGYATAMGEEPSPSFPYRDVLDMQEQRSVLGFIVLSFGIRFEPLVKLLNVLSTTGKPVSVIDDNGTVSFPAVSAAVSQSVPVRFFEIVATHPMPGEQIGEYLIGLGHRRVACFSLVEQDRWCCLRLEGLREAYSRAGLPNGVVSYPLEGFRDSRQMRMSMYQARPVRRLLHDFEQLYRTFSPGRESGFSNYLHPHIGAVFVRQYLTPLFEEALRRNEATAWVGINDMVALSALAFLRWKGVRVPQELSLIGVDDVVEAFGNGLSSYNFNVASAVRACLGHLLTHGRCGSPQGERVVEIPGMIMERGSCAPVR